MKRIKNKRKVEIEYAPEGDHDWKNGLDIDCPHCDAGLTLDFRLVSSHVDTVRAIDSYKRVFENRYDIEGMKPIEQSEIQELKQAGVNYLVTCRMLGKMKTEKLDGRKKCDKA